MAETVTQKSIGFIFKELVGSVLHWLLWWYSTGLKKAWDRVGHMAAAGNDYLGLTVWLKNFFKPMFGQNDWQGRLVSLFMRLIQVIFRFVAWLLWDLLALAIFFFWIALPLFLIWQVLLNLGLIS